MLFSCSGISKYFEVDIGTERVKVAVSSELGCFELIAMNRVTSSCNRVANGTPAATPDCYTQ